MSEPPVRRARKSVPRAGAEASARATRSTTRSTTRAGRSGKSATVPRGDVRRKAILRALHSCVIAKGYAKTTLADVAEAAGMYPSHLHYYFNGKEAILEQYFHDVSEKILERLNAIREEPDPDRQIDQLSNLFFAGDGIKKSEIGFMLESFGVAVNDNVLREEKAELDRRCKEYLVQLFEKTARPIMSDPHDCAEIAYSMLIGLRSAVYFDGNMSLADAYRLFHSAVRYMAGIGKLS